MEGLFDVASPRQSECWRNKSEGEMPTFLTHRAVLVIDDDPSSYRAIARYAKERGYTATAFKDPQELIVRLADLATVPPPRVPTCCIVFDARFVDLFQAEVIARLLGGRPRICISRSSRPSLTLKSIKLGLFDFIEKPFRVAQLAETIDRALSHCETLVTKSGYLKSIQGRLNLLTQRELEVCRLLADGQSSKTISFQLGISIKTFYVHRSNVLAKTGAKSVLDLVQAWQMNSANESIRWEPGSTSVPD